MKTIIHEAFQCHLCTSMPCHRVTPESFLGSTIKYWWDVHITPALFMKVKRPGLYVFHVNNQAILCKYYSKSIYLLKHIHVKITVTRKIISIIQFTGSWKSRILTSDIESCIWHTIKSYVWDSNKSYIQDNFCCVVSGLLYQ